MRRTPMHRQMVSFTGPQMRWLWKEAARLDVSVSELVRRAVDAARKPAPSEEAVNK